MNSSGENDSDDIGSETESFCCMNMGEDMVFFTDAAHISMGLPRLCLHIIDTPEFQRLRELKQCGVCHFLYPSAVHTRFEHSLGVCHMAQEFLQKCGADISEADKYCVLIAGLCHDLGHGPFSHLWERFLKACGIKWKHESNSVKIFKYMVETNELGPIFEKYGLKEEHMDLICNLISGDAPKDEKNFFLYEIIANKENGLDVDKFEYIMRDSKMFGQSFTLDINRILCNVRILEDNGVKYVHFRDKIEHNLRDVFVYRAKLHRDCYQHRTCKAVELMLIDALVAADDFMPIEWEEADSNGTLVRRSCKLSECHKYPKAFLKATDCLFRSILNSTETDLQKSRMLLQAIEARDLYTLVLEENLETQYQGSEDIVESCVVKKLEKKFENQYFRSCFAKFTIGEGKDSLSNVRFYQKSNVPTRPGSVSGSKSYVKEGYQYSQLMIFCTTRKNSLEREKVVEMKSEAKEIFDGIKKTL